MKQDYERWAQPTKTTKWYRCIQSSTTSSKTTTTNHVRILTVERGGRAGCVLKDSHNDAIRKRNPVPAREERKEEV